MKWLSHKIFILVSRVRISIAINFIWAYSLVGKISDLHSEETCSNHVGSSFYNWKNGRVADCGDLENSWTSNTGSESSNLSSSEFFKGRISKWLKGADCKSVQLCCSLVQIQFLPNFNVLWKKNYILFTAILLWRTVIVLYL